MGRKLGWVSRRSEAKKTEAICIGDELLCRPLCSEIWPERGRADPQHVGCEESGRVHCVLSWSGPVGMKSGRNPRGCWQVWGGCGG